MNVHETYMQRCIELALTGKNSVAPNPMVGAILVYQDKIIGEGFHRQFGEAHAEVNCINQVPQYLHSVIKDATLYVSLEPCNHYGKTPPCSDFIIQHQIKKVVIGCTDIFEKVNGSGIAKLQAAGVEVIANILEKECRLLNKRFFTFHEKKRPYIILKWAATANQKIAASTNERLLITNPFTNNLVHQWRSEEAAILVGTITAKVDNPALNNRYWTGGKQPIRLVIDKHLQLDQSLQLFNQEQRTIVFNFLKNEMDRNVQYIRLHSDDNVVTQILTACFEHNIQSIIVEGGAKLLQSFIDKHLWDEARVITNQDLMINEGLNSPIFSGELIQEEEIFSDSIQYFIPVK